MRRRRLNQDGDVVPGGSYQSVGIRRQKPQYSDENGWKVFSLARVNTSAGVR